MATIQVKRGTQATMPTLAAGEPAFTTDTNKFYVGTGSTNVLIGPTTGYTDEQAQDAVGNALVDTNTIDMTYDDAANQIKADVKTQMSVTSDTNGVKLVNDAASPGTSKYYGTNSSGTKGWYSSSAVTQYTDEQAQDAVGAALTDTATVDMTYDDAANQIKADVKTQMSVISDALGVKLVNDAASPAANSYYGTDSSAILGWHDLYSLTYTDEKAQDAVGNILTDTNTIDMTYNDATNTIKADVKASMSVTSDAGGVHLLNDQLAPGAYVAYCTNGSGTKGWSSIGNGHFGQRAPTTVIGNAASSYNTPADIAASADGHVLRRSGGTLGFGTIDSTSLASAVSPDKGGTGQSSYTTGDMLYASGSTTLAKVGIGSAGKVLTSSGTAPQWSTISLSPGTATLASDYSVGTSMAAVGLNSPSLPAGTYLISVALNHYMQVSAGHGAIDAELYDGTTSLMTWRLGAVASLTNGMQRQTNTWTGLITLASAKTLNVRATKVTISAPTWSIATIYSQYTLLSYIRVA